jgi:predicted DNA-binding transcriptional regulator AlpA
MAKSIPIPAELHDETMLTTRQLAALTGISLSTLEHWRSLKNGGPPFVTLSTQIVRYRWADVRAWREAGTTVIAA